MQIIVIRVVWVVATEDERATENKQVVIIGKVRVLTDSARLEHHPVRHAVRSIGTGHSRICLQLSQAGIRDTRIRKRAILEDRERGRGVCDHGVLVAILQVGANAW